MKLWQDFRAFAFKGNVIDLAVGVVIGAAFTKIVSVLVDTIIMPLVGRVLPGASYLAWQPGGIKVGVLIGALIDFLIIAFVLFLVVAGIKRAMRRAESKGTIEPSDEVKLLTEIRDLLRRP
jgi:large conductance mechanosensitive channel